MSKTAIVIGGGPAGLMAAERLRAAGVEVEVYDAMASVGRKFLLAGKGGLNLTHAEDRPLFDARFAERSGAVAAWLNQLDGPGLRAWAAELGVETFVGSSGRVFPSSMKAAPLLRAWLSRLREAGVRFSMRKRWLGWAEDGVLRFSSESGEVRVQADAVVLALGGASWPQLGSNGAWVPLLAQRGVDIAPLRAANCGFELGARQDPSAPGELALLGVCRTWGGDSENRPQPGQLVPDLQPHSRAMGQKDGAEWTAAVGLQPPIPRSGRLQGWSELFTARFAGLPVKPVTLHFEGQSGREFARQGEFVITEDGIEGSLVYAVSALLREEIAEFGQALIHLDLLPDRSVDFVAAEVARPRGPRSLSTHLKSRLGIEGLKAGLLREVLTKEQYADPATLAATLKRLPLRLVAARPVAEAISTAGGVRLEALTDALMLKDLPGVFCAGEMLDWEAPTGGYLLTASMASGRVAGEGAAAWLLNQNK